MKNIFARGMALATFLLAGVANTAVAEYSAPAPEDLVIYHVMIDRFHNGDPSNDQANPRAHYDPGNWRRFHGGDIEGVRQKLPYIKEIGANGIWLSPLLENVHDYHGYATFNWYNVEPNFGTLEDLQRLIHDAHELGIAVYFDMVAGHCGNLIESKDPGWAKFLPPPVEYKMVWRNELRYPPPFDKLEYFHAHGAIDQWIRPNQELGELTGLDDLKTETPYVQEQMTKIWSYWMENTGLDGFRVDTVKHVDRGFWGVLLPNLSQKATELGHSNFFTFGEIYGANDEFMSDYLGTLNGPPYKFDSALDFMFFYTVNEVFAKGSLPPDALSRRLINREIQLGPHHLKMTNFIDNHDVARFLSQAIGEEPEKLERFDLAIVTLMTSPGVPIIYYGTEQDFRGDRDPVNREDMFDNPLAESWPSKGDQFNIESPRFQLIKTLSTLRHDHAALRYGDFMVRDQNEEAPGLWAFSRVHHDDEVLVVMNTAVKPTPQNALKTMWAEGDVVRNVLHPESTLVILKDGLLPAQMIDSLEAQVWVKE